MSKLLSQSDCQSVSQSVNQSVAQSVNQSVSQSINQTVGQSLNPTVGQSLNYLFNQSFNQSVNTYNLLCDSGLIGDDLDVGDREDADSSVPLPFVPVAVDLKQILQSNQLSILKYNEDNYFVHENCKSLTQKYESFNENDNENNSKSFP